jgi:hypothetical protein
MSQNVADAVSRSIGAKVVRVELKDRTTWDGEGMDIQTDFAVLWTRPSTDEDAFGAHSGCIHKKNDGTEATNIFWGHYGLTLEEAEKTYKEKRERL